MALPADLNLGTAPDNGTGDPLRVGGQKIKTNLQYLEDNKQGLSEKGQPSGYTPLGADGLVPTSFLPPFEVIQYVTNVPATGEPDVLYAEESTKLFKIWNGTSYDTYGNNVNFVENVPVPGEDGLVYFESSTGQIKVWNGTDYDIYGGGTDADVNKVIGTLIELREYEGTEPGEFVQVLGRAKAGDGKFPSIPYTWNETSTDPDDGVTVIQVNGVTTGRWIVDLRKNLNPQWFNVNNNIAEATQSAIDYLGVQGGKITFPYDEYLWQEIPKITAEIQNHLEIDFNWSKFTFDTGVYRFLDLKYEVKDQTFRNVEIHSALIDVNMQTAASGRNHIIIGSRDDGAFVGAFNADNWYIHDFEIINMPEVTDGGNDNCISFTTWWHTIDSQDNFITNINIERVVQNGGTGGIKVNGYAADSGDANVWLDNIVIRDFKCLIQHKYDSVHRDSNIHIGGDARGGSLLIEDVELQNSGDNLIEINAMQKSVVRNAKMTGGQLFHIFLQNYQEALDVEKQVFIFENIEFNIDNPVTRAFGHGLDNPQSGNNTNPFGSIIFRNVVARILCPIRRVGSVFLFHNIGGHEAGKKQCELVDVENVLIDYKEVITDDTGDAFGTFIPISYKGGTKVNIKNVYVTLSGSFLTSGSGTPRVIELLEGEYDVNIEGLYIRTDLEIPDFYGILMSSGHVDGNVRVKNYTVESSDLYNFRAFRIDNYTSTGDLFIEESNFTKLQSGTLILDIGNTYTDKVFYRETYGTLGQLINTRLSDITTSISDIEGDISIINQEVIDLQDNKQDKITTDNTLKLENNFLKTNLESKNVTFEWDGVSQTFETPTDIYNLRLVKVEPMVLSRSQFLFTPPRTIEILDELENGDEVSIQYDQIINDISDDIFLGIFGQSNAHGSTFGVEPPVGMQGNIGTSEILIEDTSQWEQLNYPGNNEGNTFGIEVPFTYYYTQETGRQMFLAKLTQGGTGMALEEGRNDWNVNSVGELADRAEAFLQELKLRKDQFPNAKFVMYWNQGERDATQATQDQYYDNFSAFISKIQAVIDIDYLVVTLLSENFAPYASDRVQGVRNALIQFASENSFCDTLDLTPYELGEDNTHFVAEAQLQISQQVYNMVRQKFNL